jgi:carbonic anhydrase
MKKNFNIFATLIVIVGIFSCTNQSNEKQADNESYNNTQLLVEKVLTADDQAALTPDKVINTLKGGNQRFMNNNITARNLSSQVRNSTHGQYPEAIILSCIDSRVPVEYIFDRGIGSDAYSCSKCFLLF